MKPIQKRIGVYSRCEYEEKGQKYLLDSEQDQIKKIIQSIQDEYGEDSIDHYTVKPAFISIHGDSKVALFLEFSLK
ncbi:hypothetical protein AB7V82_14630 [Providencia stuartii]|uniref:hypothetical protein n=1 Tax=Providencia TaxID=586 RepID=UPI0034D4EB80